MKTKYYLAIILTFFLITIGGFMTYFHYQYQDLKKNPDVMIKNESQELVKKLSAFIELPKDEEPSIATVVDKSKLKDQLFFSKAENLDKVLIYSKAGEAILYRPSINKIIAVASITFQNNQINTTPTSVDN